MCDKIIFTTAFKDIKRSEFTHYQRSNETYINYFMNLASEIKYKLVCYVEDDIHRLLLSKYNFNDNIIFVDFNDVDTIYKKYNNDNIKVVNSPEYKHLIPSYRKTNPEHVYGEYNSITCSKSDFVAHTKKIYTNYEYYAWIDFGCCRGTNCTIPKNINMNELKNKIYFNYFDFPNLDNKIHEYRMLKSFTIFFDGSQFIVHNSLVEIFKKLCEEKIKYWISINTSDDDQNLFLQIYYDHPELFELKFKGDGWFKLFYKLRLPS